VLVETLGVVGDTVKLAVDIVAVIAVGTVEASAIDIVETQTVVGIVEAHAVVYTVAVVDTVVDTVGMVDMGQGAVVGIVEIPVVVVDIDSLEPAVAGQSLDSGTSCNCQSHYTTYRTVLFQTFVFHTVLVV
jgi:hypothetical protein